MPAGVILAAGDSQRFGSVKQLAAFRGAPLLTWAIDAMTAVRDLDEVIVVVGAHADEIVRTLRTGRARIVAAADWADGQAASLRAGVAALDEADAAVVTLGDQPLITPAAIQRVLDRRSPTVYDAIVATYDGFRGHPVLFEQALFETIAELDGDKGARSLLDDDHRVAWVPCDDIAAPDDVDTPEDLQRLA
jgi:CTP:molybdopterin cytidylyltransferase MocA